MGRPRRYSGPPSLQMNFPLRTKIGRLLGLLAVLMLASAALADGSVRLSCFPTIGVADGRTPITVTAEVRTGSGGLAPDGTRVVFSSTLGKFRDEIVATSNGVAQSVLLASPIVGVARVTASVLSLGVNANLEIEFVSDAASLSSALEYIEVVAPSYMVYSSELRILGAAGPDRGVSVRYRDVEVFADDIQINVPHYELRARNARLKLGKVTRDFQELYLKLNRRSGMGVTVLKVPVPPAEDETPSPEAPQETRDRLSLVQIDKEGVAPLVGSAPEDRFRFADLSDIPTLISAKKALVYPSREIHFHRADIVVGGSRVMRLPLFQISAVTSAPVGTDQFVNITNNQLAVDYPYYLSLKPGQTSLLRFRSGTRYSGGAGAASGTFLDYELRWNQGDRMEGAFVVSGIARKDWGVGARQFWRFGDRTSLAAQVDFPANRSLIGNVSLGHRFDGGYSASLNAASTRTVRGPKVVNDQLYLGIDRDPMLVPGAPLRFTYGLTATQTRLTGTSFSRYQTGAGLKAQVQLVPQSLGKGSSFSASLTSSLLRGHNTRQGTTWSGVASLSSTLARGLTTILTYDYLDDGFNSDLVGRHRLSSQLFWNSGPIGLSFYGTKSLDRDRANIFGDVSYRFSSLWRLGYAYSLDRYEQDSFIDYSFVVGYRIGFREVGLSWSHRTRRIGIEFLGARFN